MISLLKNFFWGKILVSFLTYAAFNFSAMQVCSAAEVNYTDILLNPGNYLNGR